MVTSKDKLLATPLAMLKAPLRVVLSRLMMSILNEVGSPPVLVQLIGFEVLKTQNSEEEGAVIEIVAKA